VAKTAAGVSGMTKKSIGMYQELNAAAKSVSGWRGERAIEGPSRSAADALSPAAVHDLACLADLRVPMLAGTCKHFPSSSGSMRCMNYPRRPQTCLAGREAFEAMNRAGAVVPPRMGRFAAGCAGRKLAGMARHQTHHRQGRPGQPSGLARGVWGWLAQEGLWGRSTEELPVG
jgi:hypothetical protein